MRRLSWLLLALTACTEAPPPRPAVPPVDPEQAQAAVQAFCQAVERGDREALGRTFSLGDLVRSTRPADLASTDARMEAEVARLVAEQVLDPGGPVRRLLAGLTLGEVQVQADTAIVLGQTPVARLRFYVARRDDKIKVVRLD